MKRKEPPARRSPIAKAVTRIRPQVVPDKRAEKLDRLHVIYINGGETDTDGNSEQGG